MRWLSSLSVSGIVSQVNLAYNFVVLLSNSMWSAYPVIVATLPERARKLFPVQCHRQDLARH